MTYGAPHPTDGRIKPRMALRELEKAMLCPAPHPQLHHSPP